jgi:hypothetical protein
MQPTFSHGAPPPTQHNGQSMGGPSSMQAGAAGSLQSSLAPGVYIYGQPSGANTSLSGQPADIYGLTPATNTMHPNQVHLNANHMSYQQHRYFSRYRWQLFVNQTRHKATVWHRVRFVQPKTFCPECFKRRIIDPDDEEPESQESGNQSQGSQDRRPCVS